LSNYILYIKKDRNITAIHGKGSNFILSLLSFQFPKQVVFTCMCAKDQVRYNDAGMLLQGCRNAPFHHDSLRTKLQYPDYISSRGSLVADGGEHSASTAKSFTTFRHGSPNTSFVTLMEHLFLPTQAWRHGNHSIMIRAWWIFARWWIFAMKSSTLIEFGIPDRTG
jgi:hypothetical protein